MTQRSRPQAGHSNTYPVPSDPGPYSSDQWAELFQVLFTGDQEATQGPLIRYLNELIVTNTTPTFTVGTGAGFCYGHWFVNSALVTFNPSNAAREDRVVLVENNTNTAYDTNLEFPTVLTDYDAGDVPAYSCRLAILTGTGPAAPRALVNAGGINMVMLAHYDIAAGGAISGLTDERDFCEFSTQVEPDMIVDRTRKFFVQCAGGYDQTSPVELINRSMVGISVPDAVISMGYGQFIVPDDFVSGMTATLVVSPNASGNIYSRNRCIYGQCGEVNSTHSASVGLAAVAITQFEWECIQEISLASAAINDIVGLEFQRDAVDALDTINDIVGFAGWIIEYTADS